MKLNELTAVLLDAIAPPRFTESPGPVLAALLVIALILVTVMIIRNERK